ncbi:MAG: hypothetical protein WCO07_00815 [bacterium]
MKNVPHKIEKPDYIVELFITKIGEEREEPVVSEEIVQINIPNSWEVAKLNEGENDRRGSNIYFKEAVIEFLFKNTSIYGNFIKDESFFQAYFEMNPNERVAVEKFFQNVLKARQ